VSAPRRRALLAALLALLVAPAEAGAHKPAGLSAREPTVLEDATVSWALDGEFARGDEVFVVQLPLDRPFATLFEVLVPHRDGLRDHRPVFALVGPGVPPASDAVREALPRPLPPGWGAVLETNDLEPRPVFFESIFRRVYWSSGVVALVAPAGRPEVWIWSPAGTRGDVVLGYGVEEGDFDAGDLLDAL
jgi:hypothetical protein